MYSGLAFLPHLSPITAGFAMGASPGRKQNTPKERQHYIVVVVVVPPVRAPWVDPEFCTALAKDPDQRESKNPTAFTPSPSV